MKEKETGYEAKIDCECVGDDSQDCPVHADVDGKLLPNGICCQVYAEHHAGRHAYNCGNYAQPMAYPVDSTDLQEAF